MTTTESVHDAAPTRWRRLSLLAIVFFTGTFIRHLINNALPASAGLAAWLTTVEGDWFDRLIQVGIAIVGVTILYGVASYLRFRYRLEPGRVLVQRGVFQREDLSVDLDRIQNVMVRQPIYAKWFGLALVTLDTAGSAGSEVNLAGVPKAEAFRLRDAVLSARESGAVPSDALDPRADYSQVLHESQPKDLVAYGLSTPGFVWVALFGAVVSQYVDEQVYRYIDIPALFGWWGRVQGGEWTWTAGIVAAVVVAALVLFAALSIAAAFLRFHRFQLSLDGSTFARVSGLLTRDEQTLPAPKIQSIVVRQNAVLRLFGRANIEVRQAAAHATDASGGLQQKRRRFLVPGVPAARVSAIVSKLQPGLDVDHQTYTKPHPRLVARTVMWVIAPIAALPTITLSFAWTPWMALAWPLALLIGYICTARWRGRAGFAIDKEFALFRSGFIGFRVTGFPLYKCQRADLVTSPSQRRHDLASFSLHLASQAVSFPYAPRRDAELAVDLALYEAESSRKTWL